MNQLALREEERLVELEAVVERGLASFVEVGQALMEIRDARLYRQSHGTFEDYCRARWALARNRAYQLIEAADVSKILDIPPTVESQARELAPLKGEPESMAAAWSEAVEQSNGKPTAEVVREVVAKHKPMEVHYSSERSDWSTPSDLFAALDAEFSFQLDVCATSQTAKCETFFTREDDGLTQRWNGSCFMNPPYGDEIPKWIEKAWHSSQEGATVVCLVPARVDTGWWWTYCRYGEVRFLRGRLKFDNAESGAPFPSAVVVFDKQRDPNVVWWEWR